MDVLLVSLVNGLSYGLLLFLLCSGLTLIYSLMGVLNFAHAAFYVLGAYLAYSLSQFLGFAGALVLAPALAAAGGALFESQLLRRVRDQGHVAEMLVTFGLSLVLLEAVQLVWGTGPVNYRVPAIFDGVIWRIGEVIALIVQLSLAGGILFELPVVVWVLSKLGIVTPKILRRYRRHAIVANLILAGILTPSPDVVSQLLLGIPMIVLYEASILISARVERKRLAQLA